MRLPAGSFDGNFGKTDCDHSDEEIQLTKEQAEELILTQVGHYAGSLFVSTHHENLGAGVEAVRWLGVCVLDGVVFRVEGCKTHTEVLVAIAKEMTAHGRPAAS